ncbi:MAG: metal ABC transporter substrate-binding protein, partial [Actinomycetota bacterium]
DLVRDVGELDQRFEAGLSDCETKEMIVSHEAFGYLADRYGLTQVGLAGLEPEGEPTAAALQQAVDLLRAGDAKAVFYEASEEARRIAEAVASDAGVQALPLNTLESEPSQGDYLTTMEENLASLREGLVCP